MVRVHSGLPFFSPARFLPVISNKKRHCAKRTFWYWAVEELKRVLTRTGIAVRLFPTCRESPRAYHSYLLPPVEPLPTQCYSRSMADPTFSPSEAAPSP